jgi:hypothetical protein
MIMTPGSKIKHMISHGLGGIAPHHKSGNQPGMADCASKTRRFGGKELVTLDDLNV